MSNIFKVAQPVRVGNFSSAPLDVSAGAIYWDTTASELFVADGSSYLPISNSSGTVTSVALSLPSIFNVTGSPVTTSGTLSATFNTQTANTFFAAPNGSTGTPTFRAIVAADIPTLNQNTTGTASNITASSNSTLTTLSALSLPGSQVTGNISGNAANVTGTVAIANGGTGQTTAAAAFNALNPMTTTGDMIYESATNTASRLPIGSTGQILTVTGGIPTWSSPATSGTVTSVAFSDASTTPIFNVSGSPVTSTGTLTITLATETANKVFAGPTSGGAAQPTFRSLVALDIPDLSATYVTQSEVGQPSGVASLDGSGKIPVSQLPASVMEYQGAWDASSNTPTLADGTGNTGDVYRVSVAGTQDLGSGPETYYVGDFVIYNGTIWQRSPMADGVVSVNGATGIVTVNAINQLTGDVTTSAASGSQSKAATVAAIQGTTVSGTTGSGNVVFSASPTFTGTITAAAANFSGAISASNFSGSSSGTNTGDQTITLTGDVTGSGTGSFATTLATVNANVGSFGSSTSIPSFTVNAKGLITAASGNAVIAPAGTLTGATLAANVLASSLTSVGTLTSLTVAGTISASNFSGSSSGTNTGDITLSAIGASPNANAATLTGQVLNLEPASASFGGVVTTGTQTFAGDKTFNGNVVAGANLSVASLFNRGDGGTTNVVQQQYKDALSLTASTTAVLAALTNDSRNFKALTIDYTISNGNDRRTGTLKVVGNNASGVASTVVSMTDQSTETADILVSWSAAMNGNNLELSYTTGAGTFTMYADIKRFRA